MSLAKQVGEAIARELTGGDFGEAIEARYGFDQSEDLEGLDRIHATVQPGPQSRGLSARNIAAKILTSTVYISRKTDRSIGDLERLTELLENIADHFNEANGLEHFSDAGVNGVEITVPFSQEHFNRGVFLGVLELVTTIETEFEE